MYLRNYESLVYDPSEPIPEFLKEIYTDVNVVQITPLAGLSNKLFLIELEEPIEKQKKFVLRIREPAKLELEKDRLIFLAENDLAPPFLVFFKNGFLSPYINGRILDRKMDRSSEILQDIARKLAVVHKLSSVSSTIGSDTDSIIWERMQGWLSFLERREEYFYLVDKGGSPINRDITNLRTALTDIEGEFRNLEELGVGSSRFDLCFCHNDLPYENILLDPASSSLRVALTTASQTNQIHFIDWEYSGLNYRYYDLANFFQEWAGNDLDNSQLLSDEEKSIFLTEYEREFRDNSSIPVEERERPTLSELRLFERLSDLHWTIWSYYQNFHSDIIEFDFLDYGRRRFERIFLQNTKNMADETNDEPSNRIRMQVLSDVHTEFNMSPESFRKLLVPADITVLAGDIVTDASNLDQYLRICKEFSKDVVFVCGNHEYYKESNDVDYAAVCEAEDVHFLQNERKNIAGHWFCGSTLWSAVTDYAKNMMNDPFTATEIRDMYLKNVEWLSENVEQGDIVVTHHLPSFSLIHPKYKNSLVNSGFASNLDLLIAASKPKLWICGHTHVPMDVFLSGTRVVINPVGYPNENPAFQSKIIAMGDI